MEFSKNNTNATPLTNNIHEGQFFGLNNIVPKGSSGVHFYLIDPYVDFIIIPLFEIELRLLNAFSES